MTRSGIRPRAAAYAALVLAAACAGAARPKQAHFENPEEAVRQLVAAMRSDDLAGLEEILGPDSRDLLHSGDPVEDRAGRQRFLTAYDEKNRLEPAGEGVMTLVVGELEWPVPIPIVRASASWYFDTEAGREELLNRRVGRNELSAVEVCLAYVDAQQEYAERDRDGDGILEYAQKFRSTEGMKDGLFWRVKEGEEESPLGELAAEATAEGYVPKPASQGPQPYHGYLYRILLAQGESAPEGDCEYVVRGNMIGGCALVAYPAEYGNSGVMTFLVNHEGVVFERDLGEETEAVAIAMTRFDPGEGWRPVSR